MEDELKKIARSLDEINSNLCGIYQGVFLFVIFFVPFAVHGCLN